MTMRIGRLVGSLGVVFGLLMLSTSHAQVMFQIRASGSLAVSADVPPGGLLTLDIVATSISAEAGVLGTLDAFTYRVVFPNEAFTLMNDIFAAPFDSVPAPAGFNGSIPWGTYPVDITFDADSGSPGATPLIADLYRTTATTGGIPVAGADVLLETLTLRVPNPDPGLLPVDYLISLNVLEAVDELGEFHTTDNGLDFRVTIVPEPAATALVVGSGLLALVARRRYSA